MTAQPPLPLPMVSGSGPGLVAVGSAVFLVEDDAGGRVFIHGQLSYAWDAGDVATRRFTAVKLAEIRAASVAEVAEAFKVSPGTLWQWGQQLAVGGVVALAPEKRGPKGPTRLTESLISRIHSLRETGMSLRSVGTAVGVSEFSVRRALAMEPASETAPEPAAETAATPARTTAEATTPPQRELPVQTGLPVLPGPVDRARERAAARAGMPGCAVPVFAPAARVPFAGLFLALPALETTGLLACAKDVFTAFPDGFYGLETMCLDAVLRALAGESRAEGRPGSIP
ncbi:putative transposase [Arthrobacter sp. A5]|uniref:putative transposase n=1 Tax=Arthrobacter sp. A5 TaxID=576926 RepID=UPI003DA8E148